MSDPIFNMRIDARRLASTAEEVQRLRGALSNRKELHARLAIVATEETRDHVRSDPSHATATRLGARPTNFRARSAASITGIGTDDTAIVRIPRRTGLARAFRDIVIRPGSGKKLLTIPADKRTYGKRAGEFPQGTFAFAFSVERRTPMLVFTDGSGVGYWLKPSVTQKQDRGLLPSDKLYRTLARRTVDQFVSEILKGGQA